MKTPQATARDQQNRSQSLNRTKASSTENRELTTHSDAWQGKVLRNRVVPPVNQKVLKPAPPNQEVLPKPNIVRPPLQTNNPPVNLVTDLVTQVTKPVEALSSTPKARTQAVTAPTVEASPRQVAQVPSNRPLIEKLSTSPPQLDHSPTDLLSTVVPLSHTTMERNDLAQNRPHRDMAQASPDLVNDQAHRRLLHQPPPSVVPPVTLPTETGSSRVSNLQMAKRSDSLDEPVLRPSGRLNPPPAFNGQGARNWLFQIEIYHRSIGQPESLRVNDAVSFLTGPALDDYGLMASQGEQPQTWEEFRRWIMQRFNHQSESETVTRLLEIRWQGSLDLLCQQFAAIVSQGEPPSHPELQRLFIRALPLDLVDLLDHTRFATWLQIKDFLIAKTKPKDYWKNMWLTTVPQPVLEDAWRRMPHLFPTAFQQLALRRQLPQGTYSGARPASRPIPSWPSQVVANPPQRNPTVPRNPNMANIRCNLCNAVGHIARQCLTATAQGSNDVLRCGRCGGIGHWAKECPTKPNFVNTTNADASNNRHNNLNGGVRANPNELGNGRA